MTRYIRFWAAVAALFFATAAGAGAQTGGIHKNGAVFTRVLAGVTTAQVSDPVRNAGQSLHVLVVSFPGETEAVTGIAVRLEASFDKAVWFPITADVTRAPYIGSLTYQITAGYGPWPYVRVRVATANAAKSMDVFYSGHAVPVVSVITQETDRFLL